MTRTKLATTLRDARIRAAHTQSDLAAIIGVQRQTIWHWEQHSSIPGLKTLRRVTDVLELDWDEVLVLRADAERALHARQAKRKRVRPVVEAVAIAVATALVG